jgi:protein-tyrosine phosphatase
VAGRPHHLDLDFLPAEAFGLPGRLGLCRAPGRWSTGRGVDGDDRLRDDLDDLVETHRVAVLVTLLEQQEIAALGELGAEARRAGLEWIHFPIGDVSIPRDADAAVRLVARILRDLEQGRNVVVHCWGGLGRAGTIAAACLVARGMAPSRAIATVRRTRPGAIQTRAQELFVESFPVASHA